MTLGSLSLKVGEKTEPSPQIRRKSAKNGVKTAKKPILREKCAPAAPTNKPTKRGTPRSVREAAKEIVMMPVSEVRPYEKNPRKNENAVKYVKESIRQFGFKVPIVIDSNRVIVCGHTRLLAAKSLGLTEVPCIMADDLTDDQIKAFRLADNKVGEFAEWDLDLLGDELNAIADASDIDMGDFGFDPELDPDQLGDSFSLPDGDKNGICQWTITFAEEQKAFIENAIKGVECSETFGNANENGNRIYEVVRQWAAQRK